MNIATGQALKHGHGIKHKTAHLKSRSDYAQIKLDSIISSHPKDKIVTCKAVVQ